MSVIFLFISVSFSPGVFCLTVPVAVVLFLPSALCFIQLVTEK